MCVIAPIDNDSHDHNSSSNQDLNHFLKKKKRRCGGFLMFTRRNDAQDVISAY